MTINGQQAFMPLAKGLSVSKAMPLAFVMPQVSSNLAASQEGRVCGRAVAPNFSTSMPLQHTAHVNPLDQNRLSMTIAPSSLRHPPLRGLGGADVISKGRWLSQVTSRPSSSLSLNMATGDVSSGRAEEHELEHDALFDTQEKNRSSVLASQANIEDQDCNFGEHELVNELKLRGHDAPHTKIIATLGPNTSSVPMLTKMIESGMNVARINCAHASASDIARLTNNVKAASQQAKVPVLVLVDVKGPDLRTKQIQQLDASKDRVIKDQTLNVSEGDFVDFTPQDNVSIKDGVPTVSVNYPGIIKIAVGKPLSIDGTLNFEIVAQDPDRVRARALEDGKIDLKRHVNLPGTYVDLPALTEKDYKDVKAAQAAGAACLALSFVRTAQDLKTLRAYTQDLESQGIGPAPMLVAKIEDQSGIDNIREIATEADGVMIARGDLGVEVPISELSPLQQHISEVCHELATPCILATEILEFMADNPRPTRAELADMGRAVTYESVDAVMLSRETATGKYPLETIQTMRDAVKTSERVSKAHYWPEPKAESAQALWLQSVAEFAKTIKSPKSLVLYTQSLAAAQMLSALRVDNMPFYVFTTQPRIAAQLNLNWGTQPILLKTPEDCPEGLDPEEGIRRSVEYLKKHELVSQGEKLVTLTDQTFNNILREASSN